MRDGASDRDMKGVGHRIFLMMVLAVVLAGSASALSVVVDVISPYAAAISTATDTPVWESSAVVVDSGSGTPKDFLLQVTNNEPYSGEVVVELDIAGSDAPISCGDITLVVDPLLSGTCSASGGHVVFSLGGHDDSVNPATYSFKITFPSAGGQSYTMTPVVKQATPSAATPILMFGGESRSVMHISGCSYIDVWVSGTLPIIEGDYTLSDSSLIACTQFAVDRWRCATTPEYDLWMSAKVGTLNNYTLAPFCAPIGSSGGGTFVYEPIEVCESHWTACIDGFSYRYCSKGELNTTRVRNCTTNVTCTPNWYCSDWGACRVNNTQLRTCTDLNECNLNATRPAVSQSCNYTAPACVEDWSCTEWSSCKPSNEKTRSCSDINSCNTTSLKPSETESCTYNGGGGGGGGDDNNTLPKGGGGDINGWRCDKYGPCIKGRHSAFCYRYTPDSGLNYTVTEDCVEVVENETEPDVVVVNSTEPVNETVPEITGNVVVEPGDGKNLWPLWLLLLLLALLAAGYIYGKKKGWFAAGGKKKRAKK